MNAQSPATADAAIEETFFVLPADAKCLPVSELTARLREKIGPLVGDQSVVTRPGHRLVPRLVPAALAALIGEFRQPSLITDAVARFSRAHDQEPLAVLDQAFEALATLIEGRILVPADSVSAGAPEPSLAAGQAFGGWEIESLVRSLDDTEIYKARDARGRAAALKIARNQAQAIAAILDREAGILAALAGRDSPIFYETGSERGRPYLAMEWIDGSNVSVAAQRVRAARDRPALHRLIGRVLDAYARLHRRGFLHGDIHTGNLLVADDGRIVIVDFGAATPIAGPDLAGRGGIPHFHDPEMARAMLARAMPPRASPASEQYALCVLVYLLLTGLHPVQSSAVQDELLRRIVRRPPLPFAARGVAAWPEAERVVGRGLAKHPARRFADVAGLARAWRAIGGTGEAIRAMPEGVGPGDTALIDGIRDLARSELDPAARAWLGLRAALLLGDAELLAAADILAAGAGVGWPARSVAAAVARARSDSAAEQKAIDAFAAAAADVREGAEASLALLAAAEILDGFDGRRVRPAALLHWVSEAVGRPAPEDEDAAVFRLHATLALWRAGAIAYPRGLRRRLDGLCAAGQGSALLWAEAQRAFGDRRYFHAAVAAPQPARPAERAFVMLALHQLTGDTIWVEAAALETASVADSPAVSNLLRTLLKIELQAPESAIFPAFLISRIRCG